MVTSHIQKGKLPGSMAHASVRMPGTCGELVQGTLHGVPFHVSCPIDLFSTVTVHLTDLTDQWEYPPDAPKAAAAVTAVLAWLGRRGLGGRLAIRSVLPRGKGMASSTADVAGAIHAACAALGCSITAAEVARLALSVEPTDGSVFTDIALYDHRTGRIYDDLGACPPVDILVLDFGGEVDTISFNQCDRSDLLQELEPEACQALELVRRGLAEGDVKLIGRGATRSALANQRVLFKPDLEAVMALAEEIGALGVNVAHSGTVIGVLLEPRRDDATGVATWMRQRLPQLHAATHCRLIGGGCRTLPEPGNPLTKQ